METEVEAKGRKTRMMVNYETEHGLDLNIAIPERYEKLGSLDATAKSLGISINTLYGWMLRLGITIRKTVVK
jgi:hypothetical protein